jgi:hypothetical protein
MATTFPIHPSADIAENRVVWTVQATLKYMLGALGVIAGVDKFTNLVADWEQYLNPLALRIFPLSPVAFMHVVGIVEIIAGLIVFLRPRVGGFIMMGWLCAIALQLILWGRFLDVAVRDLVMALGAALTLARLTPFVSGMYYPSSEEKLL